MKCVEYSLIVSVLNYSVYIDILLNNVHSMRHVPLSGAFRCEYVLTLHMESQVGNLCMLAGQQFFATSVFLDTNHSYLIITYILYSNSLIL